MYGIATKVRNNNRCNSSGGEKQAAALRLLANANAVYECSPELILCRSEIAGRLIEFQMLLLV